METEFLEKLLTKYFNHSLPQNQRDRERGLGLSLAYDIIKSGMVGNWKSGNKRKAKGAEFIILLSSIQAGVK